MRKLTLADINNCNDRRDIASFRIDSRQVGIGDLFFALPGAKVDGHSYLEQVSRQGAIGAVVSKTYSGPDYGLHLIRVEDVLATLQGAAQRWFAEARPGLVYGITGSIGKTTTKEFLRKLCGSRHRVFASPGNANSQIGLPLAILNHLVGNEKVAVMEIAMTDLGQIRRLVEITPPDIALITTIQHVHAQVFDSLEDITRAKAEIFSSSKTSVGLIPYDLPLKKEIEKQLPMRTFSTVTSKADFFLDEVDEELTVYEEGRAVKLGSFRLPGEHNRHNLLAALAAARLGGLAWEDLVTEIPHLELPERRLQCIERNGVTLVNDSYNACEASVKAALASLAIICPKATRRIAVLGPVPNMGGFSETCHEAIGAYSLDHVDLMFCLGKDCVPIVQKWQDKGRSAEYFEDKKALGVALRDLLIPGDVVLIKGANYTQLWTLVEELLS